MEGDDTEEPAFGGIDNENEIGIGFEHFTLGVADGCCGGDSDWRHGCGGLAGFEGSGEVVAAEDTGWEAFCNKREISVGVVFESVADVVGLER